MNPQFHPWNTKSLLSILAALALLLLIPPLATAQGGARVYLQQLESANGTVVVDIMAENVTNLYGAEVRIKYDPTSLGIKDLHEEQEGTQIAAGDLLSPDQGFIVANQADETQGQITYAITLLNPAPPVNGSGPLARINFEALTPGSTTLDVERVKLVSADLQDIPVETARLSVRSQQSLAEPVAAANQAPLTRERPATQTNGLDEPRSPWLMISGLLIGLMLMGGLTVISLALGWTMYRRRQTAAPAARPVRQVRRSEGRPPRIR